MKWPVLEPKMNTYGCLTIVVCETGKEALAQDLATGIVEIVKEAPANDLVRLVDGFVERGAGVADPEVGIE